MMAELIRDGLANSPPHPTPCMPSRSARASPSTPDIAFLARISANRTWPWGPDCVADDAVSCELVSTPNSLLTGNLTGNFANSGPQQRFPHLINELIQRLAAKFPTQRNREFLQP